MAVFTPTQEEINQYLARFEGDVPLVIYSRGVFRARLRLHLVESDINLCPYPYSIEDIDANKQYNIVAGFNEIKLEEFIDHDCIIWSDKIPMLFNKRLIKKIKKICPNDFIALPVTIINLTDQVEAYENRDFYIINPVYTLDVIDHEKSTFGTFNPIYTLDVIDHEKSIFGKWADDSKIPKKRVYKNPCWSGQLLAYEKNINSMIWHPSLAKELYPSKEFRFFKPEEDSFFYSSVYPKGHNINSWSHWLNGVEKTMAYPRKSLYKFMGEAYSHKRPE